MHLLEPQSRWYPLKSEHLFFAHPHKRGDTKDMAFLPRGTGQF